MLVKEFNFDDFDISGLFLRVDSNEEDNNRKTITVDW